ncbi:MAG: 3-dehydroquinate dehydratase [Ramlibacter sp.]|jgi:3-dehydroquinate dehydratase-1|nr:3-dehydroquinate dehydratase [Ramlibacter sp.]
MQPKAITHHGKPLGGARFPAICAPLVGRTREALLAEAAAVAEKQPDLIEWRVDFYEGIGDAKGVAELAGRIKHVCQGLPILFTCRWSREGGEKISLSQAEVTRLHRAVCESGHVDFIDFEMGNEPDHVRQVREASRANATQLILSFHDFQRTPAIEELNRRFAQAEQLGADVAKVAVMPGEMQDVLVLLAATLQSSQKLRIPLVSMSMAGAGAVTRLCGGAFGSALSFAIGQSASAPGQMPIEDLATALAIVRKALGPSR